MTIETHELRENLISDVSADQIHYTNGRVGQLVKSVSDALNYLFASLYPNYIGTFETPVDLPITAQANDYAFVKDDGDGHSSGYVYSELDGVTGWEKKYDVDWSRDALLSSFLSEAHPLYVLSHGRENGQIIYGGIATGEDLELNANSFDDSGKVITKNHFIPKTDNNISLGELGLRFKNIFLNGFLSDGTIALDLTNLKEAFDHLSRLDNPHETTYNQLVSKVGVVTFDGDVDGNVDLSTSGNKTATITIKDDSHSHTKATLPDFDNDVYTKVKAILQDNDGLSFTANDIGETLTPVQADIDTTEITDIESPALDKILAGNAIGDKWIKTTLNTTLTGDLSGTADFKSSNGKIEINAIVEHVKLAKVEGIDLNSITATITADPVSTIVGLTNHQLNTGEKVYIDSSITDVVVPEIKGEFVITVLNTNQFTINFATTIGGTAYLIPNNAQLLFDTTSQTFKIRREFAELSHSEINDLDLNDDHLQYARINGRIGGQTINGGSDDSNDLVLESTTSAVKGKVKLKSSLAPFTSASYSGTWSGIDLGTPGLKFRNIYTDGELIGARFENVTSNPISSGQKLGRVIYNTLEDKLYYDNGVRFKPLSSANIPTIIVSMSTETTKLVDLDAILDVDKTTNDYTWILNDQVTSQQFFPSISRTTTRSVTINSELALTGNFVLKGL